MRAGGELLAVVWLSGKGERRTGATVLLPGTYRVTWGEQSKEFTVGADAVEVSFD